MIKNALPKTNAARLLDKAGIQYELVAYEVDESNLAADHVAESLDEPVEQVFKTLVMHGDRTGYVVCIVAGNREVDLKKAARISGNKKIEMIPMKDLLNVTGYIRGGCTALGMKRRFPVFMSQEALGFPYIYVSAGQRGLQLKVSPKDWLNVCGASVADITSEIGGGRTEILNMS